MIVDRLKKDIESVLESLGMAGGEVMVERPKVEGFGDYSSNVALLLSKKLGKNPREIATYIADKSNSLKLDYIEKVEVAGPGFLNFFLARSYLLSSLASVVREKGDYGRNASLSGKKFMVEFAHPNTHKMFHIGHLRNITTGESIVRLLEANGAGVVRANYQGDVGMHIAKCLYSLESGIKNQELRIEDYEEKPIVEKVKLLGEAYARGNKAYEEDEKAKKEIMEINKKIYAKDPGVYERWKVTRQWSLDYFESIYKRVYTHYDRYYFESEVFERGKELVLEFAKKGVFEESEGAVIFPGAKFGLHNRVFITKEGNATYEGKDMGLGELQFKEHSPDLIVHVVGPEQAGYFQVAFEALAQIFPETRGREKHLIYGWVKLKKGKMSSREGNVILGEWLLDEAGLRVKQIMEKRSEKKELSNLGEVAEKAAVAAVKYSFLKTGLPNEIAFDIDESVNFEGDSGPYIMYTYARCKSVLKVVGRVAGDFKDVELSLEEEAVLRLLSKYPEIVFEAGNNYAPNVLCSYLYDLAQKFNLFYNKYRIIEDGKPNEFRLALTEAASNVLKSGLNLLGIETSEVM